MKIKQLGYSINKVLTIFNFFLIGILTMGNIPKTYREKKIPAPVNIILLVVLVSALSAYFIRK